MVVEDLIKVAAGDLGSVALQVLEVVKDVDVVIAIPYCSLRWL